MRAVTNVLGLGVVALLLTWPPAQAAPEAEVLERFWVHGDGDILLVPVTIQGKTYSFIVDTGATYTVYDTSLRHLLGAPMERMRLHGAEVTSNLERFMPPKAFVGKLPLSAQQPVLVYDMAGLRWVSGMDFQGIIGMDFLRQHVVRIDFDNNSLQFLKTIGPDEGQGIDLHYEPGTNIPCVDADVCGSGPLERFMVDTGNCGDSGAIKANLFETLSQLGKMQKTGELRSCSLGHDGHCPQGRLERLSLEGIDHTGIVMAASQSISVLGLGYWSRYRVTFDFPGSRVYLRKGKRFNAANEVNCTGLHVDCNLPVKTIERVDPGSVGAKAGIKPGDALVSVDGQSTDRSRLFPLWQRFRTPGTTLPLVLKRDGKEFAVVLQLVREKEPAPARFMPQP